MINWSSAKNNCVKFIKTKNNKNFARFSIFNKNSHFLIKNFCSNYDSNKTEIISLKDKLIKLSLLNVDRHGWSEHSIKLAANELGYSNSLSALITNGPLDLIHYTLDTWNIKLKKEIEELKQNKILSTDEKYIKALKIRLSYEIPLINTWPQAIKLGMNPNNIKSTIDKLMIMSDQICSIDDDSSLVKRIFLIKTFLITELHMLSDKSHNYSNTWDFLSMSYSINFNIFNSLSKFTMVNSAFLTIIKYSLTAFAPYDFSKVDEMLRLQKDENQKNEEIFIEMNNKI